MSDHASFMRAIVASPEDDLPRLIYADWLDEHGEDKRAEFIRVQCRISELCAWRREGNAKHPEFDSLLARESTLWSANVSPMREWLATFGIDHSHCVFARGFVSAVTCSWLDWRLHAAAIRAATPLEQVRLTTRPVFETDDGSELMAKAYLAGRYPGIEFELPDEMMNWRHFAFGARINVPRELLEDNVMNEAIRASMTRMNAREMNRLMLGTPEPAFDAESFEAAPARRPWNLQ